MCSCGSVDPLVCVLAFVTEFLFGEVIVSLRTLAENWLEYIFALPRLYKTFAYLDSALEMIAIRSNRNWKIRHARFELKTKSLCTQCYSWNALELIFFGSRNAERDKARPKNILDIGMSFAYPDVR